MVNKYFAMKKRIKRILKIVGINVVGMIAVFAIVCSAVMFWLDDYTMHGEVVMVPNVSGIHIDEAASVLREHKLDFEVVDYKYKKGVAADKVLEMLPVAGAQVKEGRRVQLTLSSSKEPMQSLPDVADNSSLREAEARLLAAGFRLNPVVRVPGEADWVYWVLMGKDTIKNGSLVPMGAAVTLLVGSGEEKEGEAAVIVDNDWFE